MERNNHDKEVQELIDQCMTELSSRSEKALRLLKKLVKKANDLNDDSLMGFAYYYQALYHYFNADIYTYRPLIKKSIYHALKADDISMLSKINNLIAVDAHNNGCFDIAYNYYILAYNDAERLNDIESIALIESNLGRLYAELKEYDLARKYLRSSIKKYKKGEKDSLSYALNSATLRANEGIISLLLNDLKASEKSLHEVDKILKKINKESSELLYLARTLLATRLSIKKDDIKKVRKEFNKLITLLKEESLVQELIDDITGLYHELMGRKMKKEAKILLDCTDNAFMSTGITYVTSQFLELKADYYEYIKDNKNLFEALKQQHKLNTKLRNEQQDMYGHAVSLMNLLNDLRNEQNKVKKENETLKQIAEVDALTGIANRFKMNQMLNDSYYENKSVAIGILDIDSFKEYNDNYGHQQGDKCLVKVAKELSKISKEYNLFCARYGGDEFVIIYEGFKEKDLEAVVKKVHDRLCKLNIKHEYSPHGDRVTISQGVCYGIPQHRSVLWSFLSIADEELYSIKKSRDTNGKHSSYSIIKFN